MITNSQGLAFHQPQNNIFFAIGKTQHRHLGISIRIGIRIGIAKKLFYPYNFFIKKQDINVKCTTIYFLVLICSASESFCYIYSFLYDFTPCFYEKNQYNICGRGLISNLAELAENSSCCLKHLSCREPVSVCFCGKEIRRRGYLKSFKRT